MTAVAPDPQITAANVPPLVTRKPTGLPPWGVYLVTGLEKTGKDWTAAAASGSDLIGRTYWFVQGETDADQYGAVPGARYEIVEHDGSFLDLTRKVWAATRQPRVHPDKPNLIVVNGGTELWEMVADVQQIRANKRAAEKAAESHRPAPVGDATITTEMWVEAKRLYRRRLVKLLADFDGPVIITARMERQTAFTESGQPTTKVTDKIRAEKNLPFDVDAVIQLTAPGVAVVTGLRSVRLAEKFARSGGQLKYPEFSMDRFWRDLGLDLHGAVGARTVVESNPAADAVALEAEAVAQAAQDARERTSERRQDNDRRGPSPDSPVPAAGADALAAAFERVGGKYQQPVWMLDAASVWAHRPVTALTHLTYGQATGLLSALKGLAGQPEVLSARVEANRPQSGIAAPAVEDDGGAVEDDDDEEAPRPGWYDAQNVLGEALDTPPGMTGYEG